jgi:hypothetical protein
MVQSIRLTVQNSADPVRSIVVGIQGPRGTQGIGGEDGPQGPQGDTGPQGATGPQGLAGSRIYYGTTPPDDALGSDDDLFIDTATADVYTHGGSTGWNYSLNLRGPQGPQGAAGANGNDGAQGPQGAAGSDGAQGAQGSQGPQGAAGSNGQDGSSIYAITGAPSDALGADDDIAIDVSNGDLWTHGGSTGWNYSGSLRGPQGPQGTQGPQGAAGANGNDGAQGPQGVPGSDGTAGIDIEQDGVVQKYLARSLDFNSGQFTITENSDGTVEVILKSSGDAGDTIIFQTNLSGFWEAAQAAATVNVNIANPGTDTFDAVTLTVGQRLLLPEQSNAAHKGLYTFNGSGVALTRVDDAAASDDFSSGKLVFVEDGELNGQKLFSLSIAASPVVVDSTALTFDSIVLPSNPEVLKSVTAASYTLLISDPNKWLKMNRASAQTLTVPTNAQVKIPVNSVIWGQVYGAGATTFSPASGAVNIRSSQGLTISKQYAIWRLKKIGTNEWSLTFFGNLVSSDFDAAGTGAAQVALHEAKSDPHPQYRPGVGVSQDGVSVSSRTENVDLAGDDFAISINSDGSLDVDLKNVVKPNQPRVLTKGYASRGYNAGTQTTGTFTPDIANGNLQYAVNGGAHTLAAPSMLGDGDAASMVIQYTNNGSAGAITTSGFTKVSGSFTTTSGDDFMCYITVINGFKHLNIVALQ